MSDITHVVKRSGAVVPFNPERISNAIYRAAVAVGGRDRERAEYLAQEVVKELSAASPPGHIPHIEEIQDVVERVLIEHGHATVAKAYILYRDERKRRRSEEQAHLKRDSDMIPWAKMWRILDWAVSNGLHTVEALNERIERGEFPNIVQKSELAYEQDVDRAAELIWHRHKELRIVLVCGPSSSGKTTTAIKLARKLEARGVKLAALNVDNYFFDLEMHPRDEFGDYDFETPQALDLSLINDHLRRLIAGEEVLIPTYDFKRSKRTLHAMPMRLDEDDILLIDSLHGLYPAMTEAVADEFKFRVYLEPLLQMKGPDGRYVRWTDLRLQRRMLRDAVYRAWSPEDTILHWHYVRSSELRNIIPYINVADCIINSAMPYELCLYRARLFDLFATWKEAFADDPLHTDAWTRACRVHRLLQAVVPVHDDAPIPSDSVMREFIGGSSLPYG